jgi:hypothetical protein
MDELHRDDSTTPQGAPLSKRTEELLEECRKLRSVPVLNLMLGDKREEELPPLSRDLWKRVAASCYRDALVLSDMFPTHRDWAYQVCAALSNRSQQLGHVESWRAYYDRFVMHGGKSGVDPQSLVEATEHVHAREIGARVLFADFTRAPTDQK